jgi:signal transduction histidine kinase
MIDMAGSSPTRSSTPSALLCRDEWIASTRAWRDLFVDGLPRLLREAIDRAQSDREDQRCSLTCRDRDYDVTIENLADDAVMVTCIDITSVQRAEAQAARAMWLNEQVLSAVSHDLRAPLGTILLWERVLRERFTDPTIRVQALDAIRESATSQTNLIAELVDAFRVLAGSLALEVCTVQLGKVLASAIGAADEAARPRGVAVRSACEPDLGQVRADTRRLRYVLTKVIEMTVGLSARGETVTVAAEHVGDSVIVVVGAERADRRTANASPALDFVIASELLALQGGQLEPLAINSGASGFAMQIPLIAPLLMHT